MTGDAVEDTDWERVVFQYVSGDSVVQEKM
jgi:hypothetical protein